jgi:hypothetical protein
MRVVRERISRAITARKQLPATRESWSKIGTIASVRAVGARAPDKQGNNRSGFVAVVGLTVWNIVHYQGRIRPLNRARSLDLKGKMGRRTLPAPAPALISNGSLRRKFSDCNESASVIRLFIRNVCTNESISHGSAAAQTSCATALLKFLAAPARTRFVPARLRRGPLGLGRARRRI